MATESLYPDALTLQTNLTGAVTDIDEDPDSPSADWLTAVSDNINSDAQVTFPTPTANPTTGAGLQQFRVWARITANATAISYNLYIANTSGRLNGGVAIGSGTLTSTTGQLITASWDASLLATADGSDVRLDVEMIKSGGAPGARTTGELGAVEWVVDYTVATGSVGTSAGSATASGASALAWAPTFIGIDTEAANGATHTYTGFTFPAGKIAVLVYQSCGGGLTISTVTVNGVSATKRPEPSTVIWTDSYLELWEADVTAGAGSVVVTASAGPGFTRGAVACWDVSGGVYAGFSTGALTSNNPVDLSLNTVAGDALLVGLVGFASSGSWTPTGYTEQFDQVVETYSWAGGIDNCAGGTPESYSALCSAATEFAGLGVLYRESSGSVGTSSGAATASATAKKIVGTSSTAAGSATASAVGRNIQQTAGTADGVATAAAFAGGGSVGSADGTSTVAGVAEIIIGAAGLADGTSTAVAFPAGGSVGSADGAATATADAQAILPASGAASGGASASGASSQDSAVGSADGIATVAGVAEIVTEAVGTADGTSTAVAFPGGGSVGTATGTATVGGVAQKIVGASGSSDSAASVSGSGQTITARVGASTASATASGTAKIIIGAFGSSAGAATAGATSGLFGSSGVSASTASAVGVAEVVFQSVGMSAAAATAAGITISPNNSIIFSSAANSRSGGTANTNRTSGTVTQSRSGGTARRG